jgi:hypothetical protein
MLFDPRIVRMFAKAASVALVWLLGASVSEGAPGLRRADRDRICDAQTPSVRKLPRHPKSFGGPVARTRRARGGLSFDLTARLHRTVRVHVDDDRDAIQNDGAATGVDPDDRAATGLRPLGIVFGSVDRHPPALAFSPRSPRGPPASV